MLPARAEPVNAQRVSWFDMSAPWKQIEALYAAARDLSPAERAAFLARECGDETVRLQVETLLGQGAAPAAETLGDHTLVSNVVPVAAQPNMVGPYRMEERLGAGGMGEVYRATDTRLGRAVALKLLHPDQVANPMLKRRFLQEARSASALNHPNIVILYDIAHDRGTDFLVMEYVGGRT